MWTFIFFLLFLGALIGLLVAITTFSRKVRELERARAEIEVEETRVFDFLHGLGEAFAEGVRSADLHRLIVEGATRILESHGGALYLVDESGGALVPAYVSKGCPPMIEVPSHILDQASSMPIALDSYLKLHSIQRGEGVLGEVWAAGQLRLLTAGELFEEAKQVKSVYATSALVAPLNYRRKPLGLLAAANGAMSTPFTSEDLGLFRTIAEQSAFALYNEAVYLQASEKKRLDHDLEIARDIQSILLPTAAPSLEGFEICGINVPARHVSGDYFDYIPVDDSKLAIPIADVSGKGIPASLIMAMCRSVIRSEAGKTFSPAEVLRRVNRQLYPDIKEDMFISMAYVILKAGEPEVMLARAGHDPPLLYRDATKAVEKLTPKGMALGIDSGEVFDRVSSDYAFRMETGDCLLLYTDGATEALDQNGLEFGLPRLIQALQVGAKAGAPGVIERMHQDLLSFAGSSQQYDDITLIAIRKI